MVRPFDKMTTTYLECRGTAKVRKDEIESLSMQLLREKGQVSFFLSKIHVQVELGELFEVRGGHQEEDDEGPGREAGQLFN